jgi:hypothetical protein
MTDDTTLGAYMDVHRRPPALQGKDGQAYSVDVYVEEAASVEGRFGAALLFVRWGQDGDRPVGHVETPYLAFGRSGSEAEATLRDLSLWQVKEHLDAALDERDSIVEW